MHLRIFCDMTNLQYICFLATAFNYRTYTILIRYFNICFFKIRHYFFFKSYILFLSLSIQTWKFLQHRCPVGFGTRSRTLKLSPELWSLVRFLGLLQHFLDIFGLILDIFRLIMDIFGLILEIFGPCLSVGFGTRGEVPSRLKIISRFAYILYIVSFFAKLSPNSSSAGLS